MPKFKVFAIEETDKTARERMEEKRNLSIFCNIKDKVTDGNWKNTRDIIVTENAGKKEISKIGSYDMMNKLHKGFYNYKQDILGECFEGGINYDSSNNAYQKVDILYNSYTITDMADQIYLNFDPTNLCNLTDYYSMVKEIDSIDNSVLINKFQKIYKFPVPLKI